MYRHYQNGQKPDETKVKNAVAQALGSSDNHASGHAAEPERHKRAIAFTRGRTVAAAAAAVLCICMSVPVIAGIAENIIGKSKFDSYTQLHSVDNRYIGYSDETVESSDVRLNIDRYMRIDNDAIVELTLKILMTDREKSIITGRSSQQSVKMEASAIWLMECHLTNLW